MSNCANKACCFKLHGDIYMREVQDPCELAGGASIVEAPLESVGIVTEMGYTNLVQTIGSKDKTLSLEDPNGCYKEIYNGTDLTLKIKCSKTSNLAKTAMAGSGASVAGAVVGETFAGSRVAANALLPFKFSGASAVVITSPVGAVAGVDYKVTPAGIKVLDGSLVLIAGTAITLNYSYPAQDRLEVGTTLGKAYEIVIDGRNIMASNTGFPTGKPFTGGFYLFKPSADKAVQLMSTNNDVLEIEISGTAFEDVNRPSTPVVAGMVPSNVGYFNIVV